MKLMTEIEALHPSRHAADAHRPSGLQPSVRGRDVRLLQPLRLFTGVDHGGVDAIMLL